MDISGVKIILNEANVPDKLFNDENVGAIIKSYNDKSQVIEYLERLNLEQKLTLNDIYDISKSRYPMYTAWLVIDSKRDRKVPKRYGSKTRLKLVNLINGCKENYQAFGVIFTVTQIGFINEEYLIYSCDLISKSNSITKMFQGWRAAVSSEPFVGGVNMVILTAMITNAISDEAATYACEVSHNCIQHCKDPMLPTLIASKKEIAPEDGIKRQKVKK